MIIESGIALITLAIAKVADGLENTESSRAYGPGTLERDEYVALHPEVPEHMVRMRRPDHLSRYFIPCDDRFGSYPGQYLSVTIVDVRQYPGDLAEAWSLHFDTPYRVYLEDYDDYNVEIMFSDRESADALVRELSLQAPLTHEVIRRSGLRPT